MNLFTIYFTLMVMITSCNSTKTVHSNNSTVDLEKYPTVLTYSAFSRGFFEELIITKTNFTVYKDYEKLNPISKKITPKKWEDCLNLLRQFNLKNLPNLKSPTNRRQFDGAAFAQLTVIQNGDTIQSSRFDHKSPPEDIKPLVEYILSIPEK